VDLSSHNTNPPGVFDGEAVPISDVADARLEEAVAALREFVDQCGRLPTAESWTEAAMRPSEDDPPTVRQLPWGHPTGWLILGLTPSKPLVDYRLEGAASESKRRVPAFLNAGALTIALIRAIRVSRCRGRRSSSAW
jgi:hypothetical protein